ncbi:MAG: nucleotidyltransferase domain-containing protein [Meiothermus sp.]
MSTVLDLPKTFAGIVRGQMNGNYRLYLFGSRVQGRATERSDYDLGLWTSGPLEYAVLEAIRAQLDELPVMQKVDLVWLNEADPEFVAHALRYAELIDER